jgi:hypothetical protein
MTEFILPAESRHKGQRRIYRLRAGELVCLAQTDSPEWGATVERLHDEGEFITDDCIGVKRERGIDEDGNELPGEWIVHPFNIGRRREPESDGRCVAWATSHGRRCLKRATHGELCDTHARLA